MYKIYVPYTVYTVCLNNVHIVYSVNNVDYHYTPVY